MMRELSRYLPIPSQIKILAKATGKNSIGAMDKKDCRQAFAILRRLLAEKKPAQEDSLGGLFSESMNRFEITTMMDEVGDHMLADELDRIMFSRFTSSP